MRLLIVTLFLLAALPVAARQEVWHRLETPHFIIMSNLEQAEAVGLTEDLLKFRFFVGRITGTDFSAFSVPKPRIFVFASDRDYFRSGAPRTTGGVHFTHADGSILLASAEPPKENWQPSGLMILRHEYSHALLHTYSAYQYPRWYDEGFAEYIATAEFVGEDKIIVGAPNLSRMAFLKRSLWTDLEDIVKANARYLQSSPKDLLYQYAVGWLMAHYLMSDAERRAQTQDFLGKLNAGERDIEQAWKDSFGKTIWEFERELYRYWGDRELTTLTFDLSAENYSPEPIDITSLPAAHADSVYDEVRFLLEDRAGQKTARRDEFADYYNRGIRPAAMAAYSIEIALFDRDIAAAQTWHAKLEAVAPDDVRVDSYAAEIALADAARPHDEEGHREAGLKAARTAALSAIRKDPTYTPALYAYAQSYLYDDKVPKNVLTALDSATTIMPDYPVYRRQFIRALILADQLELAEREIDMLYAFSTHRREDRQIKKLEKLLEERRRDVASR